MVDQLRELNSKMRTVEIAMQGLQDCRKEGGEGVQAGAMSQEVVVTNCNTIALCLLRKLGQKLTVVRGDRSLGRGVI